MNMQEIRGILTRLKRYAYLVLLNLTALSAVAGDLQIGLSCVRITPPLGTPMAGYYYMRGAEAVHDDLFAKAMVMEKDGDRIAIVSCDIIEITSELAAEVRKTAQKSTGIPGDHIMISATHSHTGPVILSSSGIYQREGKMYDMLVDYMKALPGMIAESIEMADDNMQPAALYFGYGCEGSISFNRRFFMKDGTVGWNPGKLNPNIIKPAGPIDPEVGVLYGISADGKPLMTYVNFALHLDITGGQEISADMPCTLAAILGSVKGEGMVTMFGQGCCGNINHINVTSGEPQKGHDEAARIGTILAGEVIKTYAGMDPLKIGRIQASSEIVELPLAEFSKDDVARSREITRKFGEREAAPFLEMVEAFKIVEVSERNGKPIQAEVQIFTLGEDFAMVSWPGEVFVELGLYLKERSPYPYTMVIELANGSVDYIPDRKAFLEGNYEPVSARCAPGSGELLVESTLNMLNDLKNR